MKKLSSTLFGLARRAGRFEFPVEQTQATTAAAANYELNRAALERVWPRAIPTLPERLPEMEWLYARDGSLSARHVDGEWFASQSVPKLAAERMLAKLAITGSTAVMLAPTHAQQILAALDRATSRQAILVILPGEHAAGVILSCADFSAAIAERRLWLAIGPDWKLELKAVLDANEGLAPASMMIRVQGLNQHVLDLIQKPCDEVLALHNQSHRQLTAMIHAKPHAVNTPPRKLLVATGSFELWNDAAFQLGESLAGAAIACERLDTSRPDNASALRLARLAESCDAIMMANVGRADLANLVPDNVPWVTWLTSSRVPAFVNTAERDLLVLADARLKERAIALGWPEARVRFASEPTAAACDADASAAIIADCPAISMPASVEDMSSQRLAWEWIEHATSTDSLAWAGKADALLTEAAHRVGVPMESMPTDLFREQLVAPLLTREMVRQLVQRLGVRVYGRGWDAIAPLATPISTPACFESALARTSQLIDVWPLAATHRARRAGRPMLSLVGKTWSQIAGEVRQTVRSVASNAAPLRPDQIAAWLV